jgi:hypothetical protein
MFYNQNIINISIEYLFFVEIYFLKSLFLPVTTHIFPIYPPRGLGILSTHSPKHFPLHRTKSKSNESICN